MTRLGWGTLAVAVVATTAGWLLRWPPLAALGVALLVPVLAATWFLVRPADVHIERRLHPATVRKGAPALAHLRLRNRSRRRFPGAVGLQRVGTSGLEVEVTLPPLRRGEREVRTAALPTHRRGRHTVGPVLLRRGDPFGLVRTLQRHGGDDHLLVLPGVLAFAPLRESLTRHLEGIADDTLPTGSMTFHQLRSYVPGDDVRRIHWPSTARVAHTGQLVVRQDVDDARPFAVVVADTRPTRYADRDALELGIDAAASAVVAAAAGRAPFELRTTASARIGGPTQHDVAPALELLALAEPDADGSLRDELDEVARTRTGAVAIVVTGTPEPDELAAIARLRDRFSRVLLVSVVPAGRPATSPAGLTVVQGHDRTSLEAAWAVAVRR